MLNRGRNVSSNAFKTVSILLWFSAFVLLFGCWVKCDLVGHGRHELRDGKIEKLMVNTMIAETPEDLEQYKKLPGACDVEMDKDGNIIIWYLKHSKTKEDGCSADFVTTKHDSFLLEFGIWHTSELSDCLDFAGGTGDKADSLENYATLNENRVGFSFSLKGSEFDRIKNGLLYGNDDDCTDGEMCKFGKGKCLKAADYSIGWARIKENIVDSLQAIGEVDLSACRRYYPNYVKKTSFGETYTTFNIKFSRNGHDTSCGPPRMRKDKFKEAMHCFKMENLHVPEGWKIMDPNYIDQKYQNLLTFHILPVTAMRETMQNIEKCNGECDKESTMQKCEKMSVKFSSQDYKLLVPFNPNKKTTTITTKTTKKQQTTVKQQTKTSKQEGNNTTTKGGNNPKIKKTTATKSSGISQATLLLVVSIIILIVSTICCSVCLFLVNSSDGGKGKTGTPKV